MGRKNEGKETLRALGLFARLGTTMVICIAIGLFFGQFIDRKLGTFPLFLIVFALLGGAAGIKQIYDIVMKGWDDNAGK